ncbi:RING finger protein B-like isoform X1 [Bufo bufo]|uniref:RING finger protein B-like isoform X1 n=1 Tax=Bufo bufo TaxID=8384 RepID=UPI001ABDBED7|nr:RING finger protein B-like isoform X1 [Bufo bufo]
MVRVDFYALWSVLEAPRQLISKGGRMSFQLPLPLPLPPHLLLFSLGDWGSYSSDSCVSAQLVAGSVQPQHIGTLSADCRSLVWDGEWSLDIVMECLKLAAQGMPARLCLTVSGKVIKGSGFSSSTPARRRLSAGPPSSPLLSESTIAQVRLLGVTVEEKGGSAEDAQLAACANLKDSPPLKKAALKVPLINKDGSGGQEPGRRANAVSRNPRRLSFGSRGSEDVTAGAVCPSARWGHSTCLCDPETAILIGGEGANEKSSPDSLWKLELDSDFWFQMDSLCTGSAPRCSRGHTATFDPETKKVFVYGGQWERRWLSNVYVLDTLDWKWTLLTAVGKVPTLSYHTAVMYQRELYVFGGLCPQVAADSGVGTNALYIFNSEYKIWYQPIVEGERPLPRYGHSATLLGNRLVLFGGRHSPSSVYLNDVHILDLGYMEYRAVSCPSVSERPSPRW